MVLIRLNPFINLFDAVSKACCMAVELGLNRYTSRPNAHETNLQRLERRNRERAYLVLFVHNCDHSLSMQTRCLWMLPEVRFSSSSRLLFVHNWIGWSRHPVGRMARTSSSRYDQARGCHSGRICVASSDRCVFHDNLNPWVYILNNMLILGRDKKGYLSCKRTCQERLSKIILISFLMHATSRLCQLTLNVDVLKPGLSATRWNSFSCTIFERLWDTK